VSSIQDSQLPPSEHNKEKEKQENIHYQGNSVHHAAHSCVSIA
jgi:hypothetical protein